MDNSAKLATSKGVERNPSRSDGDEERADHHHHEEDKAKQRQRRHVANISPFEPLGAIFSPGEGGRNEIQPGFRARPQMGNGDVR
jgi:hypothetical protein